MVISFEEKDRKMIESKGMTIIESKRMLYKICRTFDDVWRAMEDFSQRIVEAWNAIAEIILEAADSVRMVMEVVKDVYHRPTSCRYRFVKILSKCTGTDVYFGWKITRRIKKLVARSCL